MRKLYVLIIAALFIPMILVVFIATIPGLSSRDVALPTRIRGEIAKMITENLVQNRKTNPILTNESEIRNRPELLQEKVSQRLTGNPRKADISVLNTDTGQLQRILIPWMTQSMSLSEKLERLIIVPVPIGILLLGSVLSAFTSFFILRSMLRKFQKGLERQLQKSISVDKSKSIEDIFSEPTNVPFFLKPIWLAFEKYQMELKSLIRRQTQQSAKTVDLIQMIAHDVRNPLAGVRSSIETLEETLGKIPTENSRELIKSARREYGYFESLIDQLLKLADIHRTLGGERNVEEINLKNFIMETFESSLHASERLDLPKLRIIESGFVPNSIRVNSKSMLKRVFANIFSNSLDFAQNQIEVKLCYNMDVLNVLVVDDGEGFSEYVLSHFGVPLDRDQIATNRFRISTGLGLYSISQMIDGLGGQVSIQNGAQDSSLSGACISFSFVVKVI